MAWRCETFREIAPTHTTGRESTPGPQYRSQHPTQAHPPGLPTTPHPSQRAHLLLEKAPLQLPRRPRGPLWKAQVHEGSLCAAASRARQGAPSHRFRGTLELVWSTAPREHCRLRSFLRTHLLSGIQAGPQGATPPVSKICQNIFAGFAQTGSHWGKHFPITRSGLVCPE